MTREQVTAIQGIADALIEAVHAAGNQGAPSGVLYAAAMSVLSLEQYTYMMQALVTVGKLKRRGHLYFAAD